MATSAMTPPAHAADFLAVHGWGGADVVPLAGDASFRRYFRVHKGADRAMLMDAGLIVEEGPARELIDNPRNERTRAFLERFSKGGG